MYAAFHILTDFLPINHEWQGHDPYVPLFCDGNQVGESKLPAVS